MIHCFLALIILFCGFNSLAAQDDPTGNTDASVYREPSIDEVLPGFRHQAVELDISARVLEQNSIEIWNETHQRVTIPGRPVDLKLVGTNIVIAVQFIPYLRRSRQNMLVAQGQIWVDIPAQGIRYQTTMQTIPIEFGEPIYFFPLGSAGNSDEASIEIMITMQPYEYLESADASNRQAQENNDQGNNNPP